MQKSRFDRVRPWSPYTIIIILILFTPVVGGILAGINHRRMGFPKKAKLDWALAAFCFALYALYFAYVLAERNSMDQFWLFIPSLAVAREVFGHLFFAGNLPLQAQPTVFSEVLDPTLLSYPPFLLVPPAFFILGIYLLQRTSFKIQPQQVAHSWSAYLLAAVLALIVGFFLAVGTVILASLVRGEPLNLFFVLCEFLSCQF